MNEDWPVRESSLDLYSASMYAREQALRRLSEANEVSAPQLLGLRFGTVVGNSPGQRTDLGPMAMLKSAYTTGALQVHHPETSRAFLWLRDLDRALVRLLERRELAPRFRVFHLASFNSNVDALEGVGQTEGSPRCGTQVLKRRRSDQGRPSVWGRVAKRGWVRPRATLGVGLKC